MSPRAACRPLAAVSGCEEGERQESSDFPPARGASNANNDLLCTNAQTSPRGTSLNTLYWPLVAKQRGARSLADVHEIAPNIYRIAHFGADAPLEFAQFLIDDERPLLFHTGQRALFPETLEAVKSVLDPATLAYISYSHVEADECGAMNQFLNVAPNAEIVHGAIGQMIGQSDFFDRAIHAMQDDQVLDLGEKKLRFLVTPHVPHAWDAILVYEDTTRTLFCSDLFTVFGKDTAVTDSDLIERTMTTTAALPGYLPVGPHTSVVFDRLIALNPKALAGHHAPTYIGDARRALDDLRSELLKTAQRSR